MAAFPFYRRADVTSVNSTLSLLNRS